MRDSGNLPEEIRATMGTEACCARTASGHAATPPARPMNSRRLISEPWPRIRSLLYRQRGRFVHHGKIAGSTFGVGHKRTSLPNLRCPLYPRKRTFARADLDVRFGPKADIMQCSKTCHSITSSAVVSSEVGMSSPSAFAVLRLITRSNLVGC